MKKIITLIFIVSSISFLYFSTKKDCKKYFNGKWKYERYDVEYIYVERNEKKQFEYMENGMTRPKIRRQ